MCGQRYAVPGLRVAHAPRVHGQAGAGALGNGSVAVVRGHGTTRPPRCFSGEGDIDHTEDLTAAIVHQKLRIASSPNDEVMSGPSSRRPYELNGRSDHQGRAPSGSALPNKAIGHVDAGIHAIRQVTFGLATKHK